MNLHDPDHGLRRVNTADFLSLIGLALFVTYAVTVLNTILPVAVLQPDWLVTFISALLDSAPLALLGLGLVHLVAYLEPDDERIRNRRDAVARWAIGAVIGYLLLIPLQAASAVQGHALVTRSQGSAMEVALERAAEFRSAIEAATSVEDLQQRITTLQGPGLRLTDTRPSLPELKAVLVERLAESVRSSATLIHSPWNPGLWAIVQRTLRVLVLSLAYGLAFAAGSQRPDSQLSLLREAQMRWDLFRARVSQHRQGREAMGARTRLPLDPAAVTVAPASTRVSPARGLPADMAYFHQLSVEEKPPPRP